MARRGRAVEITAAPLALKARLISVIILISAAESAAGAFIAGITPHVIARRGRRLAIVLVASILRACGPVALGVVILGSTRGLLIRAAGVIAALFRLRGGGGQAGRADRKGKE